MRCVKLFLFSMLCLFSSATFARADSISFKVAGNCGMCKNRIETSLKDPAIFVANWNVESKLISVVFDSSRINTRQLQQRIAAAGHDTEQFSADNTIYDQLPGCCRYPRSNSKKHQPKAAKDSVH